MNRESYTLLYENKRRYLYDTIYNLTIDITYINGTDRSVR